MRFPGAAVASSLRPALITRAGQSLQAGARQLTNVPRKSLHSGLDASTANRRQRRTWQLAGLHFKPTGPVRARTASNSRRHRRPQNGGADTEQLRQRSPPQCCQNRLPSALEGRAGPGPAQPSRTGTKPLAGACQLNKHAPQASCAGGRRTSKGGSRCRAVHNC